MVNGCETTNMPVLTDLRGDHILLVPARVSASKRGGVLARKWTLSGSGGSRLRAEPGAIGTDAMK